MATAESKRPDCIDAVSIVTPNHLHFAPAKMFLKAGIHVICDKPLTTTVDDALALAQIAKKSGLVFGLTHNYTGYPTVRQAREMISAGELGHIRLIQVEYAQDWLTTPLEATGQKQAVWRTDPAQSGPAGSLGDIGTHAYNIACFVSGLSAEQLAADVSTFVPGRRLDDNVQVLLRYQGGTRGMLWASQVAVGNENNLRLRIYGEKGGLDWSQENPNYLHFSQYGKPTMTLTRNGAGATPSAKHASRIPSGHPEGYLEAFAQLYTDLAEQIAAHQANRPPAAESLLVPTVDDGVAGVQFIAAVLDSSKQNAAWVKFPHSAT
jgi:predicted dehydrogenase